MTKPLRGRIRARLIPNARQAHKLWSMRLMGAGAAVLALWPQIPPEVRALLPWSNQVGAAVLVLSMLARVLKQGDTDNG